VQRRSPSVARRLWITERGTESLAEHGHSGDNCFHLHRDCQRLVLVRGEVQMREVEVRSSRILRRHCDAYADGVYVGRVCHICVKRGVTPASGAAWAVAGAGDSVGPPHARPQ